MPAQFHHQCITRQALKSAGISASPELISDYSSFPDFYHRRYQEIKPYMFISNGIEFHYAPHTPVDEFYRYWNCNESDGTFMVSTASNRNRSFCEAGFAFYLEHILDNLHRNNDSEAEKFLGCLLHFLEDASFGVHALEGTDGTDIYVLDRMSGKSVAKYICSIPLPEAVTHHTVTPEIFAATPAEFPALLYRRCADAAAVSRQAVFDTALDYIIGKSQNSVFENQRIMFNSSVQLAADTAATIYAIANGTAPAVTSRKLTDFAPFHYPIGGGGGFQLLRYEEVNGNIRFGVNVEARLLYNIPGGCYKDFHAVITGNGIKQAELSLINDGKICQKFDLEGNCRFDCAIDSPANTFGFIVRAKSGIGSIAVNGGVLGFEG